MDYECEEKTLIESYASGDLQHATQGGRRCGRPALDETGLGGTAELPATPGMASARSGSWQMARVVLAMLSAPRIFRVPMARLRMVAMARGAMPA